MIEIVPATLWHAALLAPLLRKQDIDEVQASGGYTPLEALTLSVKATSPDMRWSAGLVDQAEPFCMWGAAAHKDDPTLGVVWLLGSDHICKVKFRFLLESISYVQKMHERFSVLANYVDARNTVSMRWLEVLGFRSIRVEQHHGYERRPFILYASYNNV